MKLLRKYDNAASANVVKSVLDSCGIETYLAEPPVVLKAGSFRLMIVDERYDEAIALLDEHQAAVALPDDWEEPPASPSDKIEKS